MVFESEELAGGGGFHFGFGSCGNIFCEENDV